MTAMERELSMTQSVRSVPLSRLRVNTNTTQMSPDTINTNRIHSDVRDDEKLVGRFITVIFYFTITLLSPGCLVHSTDPVYDSHAGISSVYLQLLDVLAPTGVSMSVENTVACSLLVTVISDPAPMRVDQSGT